MTYVVPQVVFTPTGDVRVEDLHLSRPTTGEVLVRTTKTQVSAGSERNALELCRKTSRPTGYTSVGVIEEVGPDVAGYSVGYRVVTISPHRGAELVQVDQLTNMGGYLGSVPDGVSDSQATFAVLGDVALHGVRRAQPYLGESVAVFGQGLVGQLTTAFAALAGADPIIAIDILDERLEKSHVSGATHVVNARQTDVIGAIHELTGGGARVVFMAARDPRVMTGSLKAAARGGTVCLTGSPPGTVALNLQEEILRHELNVLGNYQSDYPVTPYHRFQWTRSANRSYILKMIARGRIKVDHLITHDVPYTQASEIYSMIAEGPEGWLGVLFDWSGAHA